MCCFGSRLCENVNEQRMHRIVVGVLLLVVYLIFAITLYLLPPRLPSYVNMSWVLPSVFATCDPCVGYGSGSKVTRLAADMATSHQSLRSQQHQFPSMISKYGCRFSPQECSAMVELPLHFCMQMGLSVSSTPRALVYSMSARRAASQRSALVNSWVDITPPLPTPSQLTTIRT
jgi:hypothetical protein